MESQLQGQLWKLEPTHSPNNAEQPDEKYSKAGVAHAGCADDHNRIALRTIVSGCYGVKTRVPIVAMI